MRNTVLQQKTPGFRLFPIRCVNHGFRNATTLRCVTLGAGGSQNDAEIMDFRVTSHDPPQATVARWPAKRQSLNRFSVPLSPRPQIVVPRLNAQPHRSPGCDERIVSAAAPRHKSVSARPLLDLRTVQPFARPQVFLQTLLSPLIPFERAALLWTLGLAVFAPS